MLHGRTRSSPEHATRRVRRHSASDSASDSPATFSHRHDPPNRLRSAPIARASQRRSDHRRQRLRRFPAGPLATMSLHMATHSSQMNTPGPAISCSTRSLDLPQNEHRIVPFTNFAGAVRLPAPIVSPHSPTRHPTTAATDHGRTLPASRT